ncbi:hypothetical protein E3O19_13110 [Cryobacterium algoritolerans]|uniref:Large exoprotein n=1 Tax=Cryobacterium algoritolerans TaxID=1259184 RepID=A0A4R8WPW1_9MICO|nr:hypothetical protein [Cryobacterium algoritolerans]TFC12421.1 hypothetical protein E3O19_13110 [Cryobacterium algoritolerans]
MSSEVLGGGVMVAVAAALWVTYLMPTWARRRQYVSTERNAVRLQQTLRILAETSEVPQQVRLEANARTVVTQRKLLAQAEDDARAEARAVAGAATAERRAVADAVAAERRTTAALAAATRSERRGPPISAHLLRSRRLRRVRALSTLVLLVGVVLLVSGALSIVAGGPWTLAALGAATAALAFGSLSRLARTARHSALLRSGRSGSERAAAPIRTGQRFEPVQFDEVTVATPTWTPQALPLPLHLAPGTIAQTAMASADAAAGLRKAAAEAEVARRAAQLAMAVTPLRRETGGRPGAPAAVPNGAPAVSAASNRFASMGVVGETAPGMTDLDAVLRRRRAVG